ncbi:TPA: hypothetical protein DCF80_02475 [Candidatus Saccharibacteria bacterium]|nr:hypothetical protein [Candidatus Saccharibacteria bacterium]HRK40762.1 prepilin-type N-terminal cleavage/methylation domain-containing protein [Candidatus Saccharibacteria bacterium]
MKYKTSAGFTVPELIVTIIVFAIIANSVFLLLFAHIGTSATVQIKASALALATEQMEYLRSLPYDSLAVQGGGIVTGATPMPANKDVTRAGRVYEVTTDIRYADDAFDGCLNYGASQAALCRNYKVGTVLTDTNPRDYKVGEVKVKDKKTNKQFAILSSQFTSRVAETAGNSSAILVTILDSTGSPVAGATARIQNSTVAPAVDQSFVTDSNGTALFLDVTPDTGADYIITASKTGYSTLTTIAQSGSLVPTYPNVTAITQQVSSATLHIDQIATESLAIETVDTAGSPVANMSFVIKGGIKLYTDLANTAYSYQQTVTTNASGVLTLGSLTPGTYMVCYNAQPQPCQAGSSRRLAALQVAYGGSSFQPFTIPAGIASLIDGGPMQRIKLVTTTSSSFPRIETVSPTSASSSASDADMTEIQIDGANLSGASVSLRQGGTTIAGTTVGSDTSTSIIRNFNLSGGATGAYELVVTTGSGTVIQTGVLPGTLGGLNVIP